MGIYIRTLTCSPIACLSRLQPLFLYTVSFRTENVLDPARFLLVVPEQVTTVYLNIQPKQTPEEALAGAQKKRFKRGGTLIGVEKVKIDALMQAGLKDAGL